MSASGQLDSNLNGLDVTSEPYQLNQILVGDHFFLIHVKKKGIERKKKIFFNNNSQFLLFAFAFLKHFLSYQTQFLATKQSNKTIITQLLRLNFIFYSSLFIYFPSNPH